MASWWMRKRSQSREMVDGLGPPCLTALIQGAGSLLRLVESSIDISDIQDRLCICSSTVVSKQVCSAHVVCCCKTSCRAASQSTVLITSQSVNSKISICQLSSHRRRRRRRRRRKTFTGPPPPGEHEPLRTIVGMVFVDRLSGNFLASVFFLSFFFFLRPPAKRTCGFSSNMANPLAPLAVF